MRFCFVLSGEDPKLAAAEVKTLLPSHSFRLKRNLLFLTTKRKPDITLLKRRLALTRSIHQILSSCVASNIERNAQKTDWQRYCKGSFAVRVPDLEGRRKRSQSTLERRLAKIIWDSLKRPRVDLKSPNTQFSFLIQEKTAYAAIRLWENKEPFADRRAHLRPFPHPSSLHPKIARAIVNLTGVKGKETLLDPMCGAGGFLIEAGLMGIRAKGSDIGPHLIKGCEKNLKRFGLNTTIAKRDIFTLEKKVTSIVTDLPYGLNSMVQVSDDKRITLKAHKRARTPQNIRLLEEFYLRVLTKIHSLTKKSAVIVMPNFVRYAHLIKKAGFHKKHEFTIYVHRSLRRKILVLTPQDE